MEIRVNITKSYLFIIIGAILLIGSFIFVFAYNNPPVGGNPTVMGHSIDEVYGFPNCNATQSLVHNSSGWGCSNLITTINYVRKNITFSLSSPDSVTYSCQNINLQDYCADEDGCDIRLEMQNKNDGYDQVRTIDEHIYMEQSSMSGNKNSGIYGWTRQEGGGDYSWITGTSGQYTLFDPWSWVWMLNYAHSYCPGQTGTGPAYADPYVFNFMGNPSINTKVIVYD
ncbi:MAG: hypothetical protein WCK29_02340 [archaeon]